jgi:hypothetical protein
MTASGIFRLGWADLARGLVLAVLTAVMTSCQQAISNGNIDPSAWDWRAIGGVALAAIVAYLLKNLVSDEQGRVLGRIGAVAALPLLGGALSGCAGWAIGGSGGYTTAGAAAVKLVHTEAGGCPDLAAQGAIPLAGVALSCSYDPQTRRTNELATIQSADPTQILLSAIQTQQQQTQAVAAMLQQLAPLAAQAAMAAAGPGGVAAAAALAPRPSGAPPASAPVAATTP